MSVQEIESDSITREDEFANPRYDLDEDQLEKLEHELFAHIEQKTSGAPDVYAVWMRPTSRLANVVRTHEAKIFPEIPDIVESYEDLCLFLAIVDTRGGQGQVVHGFRFSGRNEEEVLGKDGELLTGMPFIDDIVESDQGLTAEAFLGHYRERGVDLSKCISVETNFRIKETDDYNGVPISQVGYLSLFNHIDNLGVENSDASIFAHLNVPAVKSLGAVGVKYQDIAGVPGLKTPTVGEQEFDDHYRPVEIPFSDENVALFRQLAVVASPELEI